MKKINSAIIGVLKFSLIVGATYVYISYLESKMSRSLVVVFIGILLTIVGGHGIFSLMKKKDNYEKGKFQRRLNYNRWVLLAGASITAMGVFLHIIKN